MNIAQILQKQAIFECIIRLEDKDLIKSIYDFVVNAENKSSKTDRPIPIQELMEGVTYEGIKSYFPETNGEPFGEPVGREVW